MIYPKGTQPSDRDLRFSNPHLGAFFPPKARTASGSAFCAQSQQGARQGRRRSGWGEGEESYIFPLKDFVFFHLQNWFIL